jgi:DNA polymerase-3 subunit beta
MKFSAARETLLKPLQTVVGVVERRQTMPILSNVLLSVQGSKLSITATDLEVEMVAEAEVKGESSGDITLPGRKLHDIFRALPEGLSVEFNLSGDRLTISRAQPLHVVDAQSGGLSDRGRNWCEANFAPK